VEETRKQRKAVKCANAEDTEVNPGDADVVEMREQRKAAKLAAGAAAQEAGFVAAEADAEEMKKRRKAAKRAARADSESAAAGVVDTAALEAKKMRRAAKRMAAEAADPVKTGTDAVETMKQRKAAKHAVIEGMEDEEASVENQEEAAGQEGKGKSKGKCKEFEVFVAGLPISVTSEDVKKYFSKCGKICSVNIPCGRDGRHRGKAFIEFESKENCNRALKLHDTHYGAHLLSIHMAKDNTPAKPEWKYRKDLEVVVGGLPFSMSEEAVKEHFAKCGTIMALRMPPKSDGKHRGLAFISFTSKEECGKALKFHNTTCDGRRLYVYMSGETGAKTDTGDSLGAVGQGKGHNKFEIFLGGLPYSVTEAVLRKDFSECGQLVALRMVVDAEGSCKGSAFLEYKEQESRDKALAFDGTEYGGRILRVRMAGSNTSIVDKSKGKGKGGKGGKGNKELEIVVGGLPFSATREAVRKDFEECGEIARFVMPLNDKGSAKGNAYIEYRNKEACEKALAFHDTEYGGRWIRVRMSADRTGAGDNSQSKEAEGKDNKDASLGVQAGRSVQFESDDE